MPPIVPTQEQIDAAKAQFGDLRLVESCEGDQVLIKKMTSAERIRMKQASADVDKRPFVNAQIVADSCVFPKWGSPEYKELFDRLPVFIDTLSGEVLSISGATSGPAARKV